MKSMNTKLMAVTAFALAIVTQFSRLNAAEGQNEPEISFRAPAYQPVEPKQLRAEFPEPPMERRLRAWWFWVLPYVTSEGLAKDIAAMDRAGMGGALMMTHVACNGIPKGWENLSFGKLLVRVLNPLDNI